LKSRYYVSVQNRKILQNRSDDTYEFEIEATRDEVDRLQEMFNDLADADDASFFRAHAPAIQYHEDRPNDVYDAVLRDIYRTIRRLGTEETRKRIEGMEIASE